MPGRQLTGESLEGFFDELLREGYRGEGSQRVKSNWRATLLAEFDLTETQRQRIAEIPVVEVRRIQKALASALYSGRGGISVALPADDGTGQLTIMKNIPGVVTPAFSSQLKAPILKCTFDADCGGWECGPPI
jgi:hypothetical protein